MSTDGELPLGGRRNGKSEAAFRTISEVAEDLDVPQHVLRFWESKFPQVKPLKRGGGRRYYRPEDVLLLRRIRDFLYSEGYTIKGVQKLLREGGHKDPAPPSDAAPNIAKEPQLLLESAPAVDQPAEPDADFFSEPDDAPVSEELVANVEDEVAPHAPADEYVVELTDESETIMAEDAQAQDFAAESVAAAKALGAEERAALREILADLEEMQSLLLSALR